MHQGDLFLLRWLLITKSLMDIKTFDILKKQWRLRRSGSSSSERKHVEEALSMGDEKWMQFFVFHYHVM